MIKRTEWKKESLDENSWRVKAPGGWIVYSQISSNKGNVAITSCFAPDPYHEWQIIPPELYEAPVKVKIPECLL